MLYGVTTLCCFTGKLQEASLLFDKMQKEGVRPGKVCHSSYVCLQMHAHVLACTRNVHSLLYRNHEVYVWRILVFRIPNFLS